MSAALHQQADLDRSNSLKNSDYEDKKSIVPDEEQSHGLDRGIDYDGVSRIEALCKSLLCYCLPAHTYQLYRHGLRQGLENLVALYFHVCPLSNHCIWLNADF
jgi:hypothetical protein